MVNFVAIDSADSVHVDANVIINLLNSDPTGSSLQLLVLEESTTYITDTVAAEVARNVIGSKNAVFIAWLTANTVTGEVVSIPTGIPVGGNQGEESILWSIENGFGGPLDGNFLFLTGDADARAMFPDANTANTMEFANSLLVSGEITLGRYFALTAQILLVAEHEVIGPDGANFGFVPGVEVLVNDVVVKVGISSITVNGEKVGLFQKFQIDAQTGEVTVYGPANCFAPGTLVDMWPADLDSHTLEGGEIGQDAVRAAIWQKPIEEVKEGDVVVSFDAAGRLVPRPVVRTFRNDAKILLDYFGTRVTPGHVYYRADSQKADPYQTLIDILRDDGVILHQDGRRVRAATGAEVDGPQDRFVKAVAGRWRPDGTFEQLDEGRLRLGTRFLVGAGPDRTSWSIADLIDHAGGVVDADDLIRVGTDAPVPFLWSFADRLPKPEDFVLACSGTTLEEIFRAGEWEDIGPRLPAPMVLDRGRVQPVDDATRYSMPRNEPLNVQHRGSPARRSP